MNDFQLLKTKWSTDIQQTFLASLSYYLSLSVSSETHYSTSFCPWYIIGDIEVSSLFQKRGASGLNLLYQ